MMYTLGVLNELSLDESVGESLAMEGDVAKDETEASVGVCLSGNVSCVGAVQK